MITLTSTSSLTMVFNSILVTKILKEKFTRYDLLSIVIIAVGSSICVFFSNYTETDFNGDVSHVYPLP